MKAFCIQTDASIAPFEGSVGQLTVGGKSLSEVQQEALIVAGFERVTTPPVDEPYLLFSAKFFAFSISLTLELGRSSNARESR